MNEAAWVQTGVDWYLRDGGNGGELKRRRYGSGCENCFVRQVLAGGMLAAGVAMMAVAGCKHVQAPTPISQLNAQQAHGHAVFQANCAVCHSDREDRARNGPALVGMYKKPYLPSGAAATDERVTATIERGRGMMPAMGAQVGGEDLGDVLAYLHTL